MPAPLHRCLTVWVIATAVAVGLVAALAPIALAPAARFDDVLVRTCAVVALLAAAWLWVLTTAVVVEAATGTRTPGVPAPLRGLVLAACGVAIVTGLALPAQATPGEQHRDRRPATTMSGLPLPDRAVTPPPAVVVPVVVVEAGDTLWDLAAADLGPDATAADVETRWREIYAANRTVIGSDPDLIQPAQRLRLPAH